MMTTEGSGQDHLNGQSGFLLAVFIVVSVLVIWPVKIPLPAPVQRTLLAVLKSARIINDNERKRLSARTLSFPLGLETAPVIAVILCLATTTINGSTVRLGIKGDANIKPYDVLVLFISLVSWLNMVLDLLKLISPRLGLYFNSFRWHRCPRSGRFLGISAWR